MALTDFKFNYLQGLSPLASVYDTLLYRILDIHEEHSLCWCYKSS